MGFALKNFNSMRELYYYQYLLKDYRNLKNADSDEEKVLKDAVCERLYKLRLEFSLSKFQLENYATNFKNK